MDRVEVVRGPASLLYGSGAIGGVVNMFTYDMPREWGYGTRTSVASHLSSVNRMGAGTLSVRHGGENLAASARIDRKSTRLNSSHVAISYAVFCLKKKSN